MNIVKERFAEPIPGYLLHEPLGQGGFGEVWKCEAPGGLYKAIKFVAAEDNGIEEDQGPILEEMQAIQQIKSIRHPFLLSIERVELIESELVIVMELADCNLLDVYDEQREANKPGIPREDLLRYLYEAADVIELMNHRHNLLNLDVKPANLFLVGDHVKVADFGQVHRLLPQEGEAPREGLTAITPLYAAPELFRGEVSSQSDQYSLAIVYQELLTGTMPFDGNHFRQLAMQHCSQPPDLGCVPEGDRIALNRAMSKSPQQRFGSCKEFVEALKKASPRGRTDVARVGMANNEVATASALATHLPDYQLVRTLRRTPTTEAWEARDPSGATKSVRLLYGVSGKDPRLQEAATVALKNLKHKALPELELRPGGPGCLLLISDFIEGNLKERFQECRGHGAKGIPRKKLLSWLRQTAEALDELAWKGNQHLGLDPQKILLQGDRVLLADFGMIPLFWLPTGQLEGHAQMRYSAPEVMKRQPHASSDQYSLAVIFQEMLTGIHPLHGRKAGKPNLAAASVRDRSILARALSLDPSERYESCVEFIEALEFASPWSHHDESSQTEEARSETHDLVIDLISEAYDSLPVPQPENWVTTPEGSTVVETRFAASLPPKGAKTTFERICKKWDGKIARSDENSLLFELAQAGGFWNRWVKRGPKLVVEIRWSQPQPPTSYHPEIVARIRTAKGASPSDVDRLHEIGPSFLDDLRSQLTGHNDRRIQERVLWTHPVQVSVLHPDGTRSDPMEGQGKDLSLSGMGVYVPDAASGHEFLIEVTTPSLPHPVSLRGRCVRVNSCAEGWFEAGILFE